MSDLQFRSALLRADAETGTVSGIAVPWDTATDVGGYVERIARGAVQPGEIKLFWQHVEPIGKVVDTEDRDEGLFITAKISDTALGRDALTLLRDGVVNRFSIGFEALEHVKETDGSITRTKIAVREVSVVNFPAYRDAAVTGVRQESAPRVREENTTHPKEAPIVETATKADLIEVRTLLEDMDRKIQALPTGPIVKPLDTRSAGEVLKAIVAGDSATIEHYEHLVERAYTGGTTADTVIKDGWVGDLTRLFDASSGVLADVFSTGVLPNTGNNIEFAELATNTIDVAAQAAEGDDIGFGRVTLTTRTAPVKTYAGGTTLSRQQIERSTVGVLNTSLDALAMAAGARKKIVLRTAYDALVTARKAIAADAGVIVMGGTTPLKLSTSTATSWEEALIDAALVLEAAGLTMDTLVVSAAVFKKLRGLTVSGERVFQTGPNNASGTLNLPGLAGNLAGLSVRLDSGQTGIAANFTNKRALRQYDSALVKLSDENIVNLSKSFAVYRYGAVAAEIPAGVIPVKFVAE